MLWVLPGATTCRNAIAGQSDMPEPTFVSEIDPDVISRFVTRTSAHELFGLRIGETVAEALRRIAIDGWRVPSFAFDGRGARLFSGAIFCRMLVRGC